MISLDDLLKSASYDEALEKLAAGFMDQAGAAIDQAGNFAAQQWQNPMVRQGLIGAGIGAGALGLGSLAFGDRKKRSLMTDILTGAGLGAAGGVGYNMWNSNYVDPANAGRRGQVSQELSKLRSAKDLVERREAQGDMGNVGMFDRFTNARGRLWDRWMGGNINSGDALGMGTGVGMFGGSRLLGRALDNRARPNIVANAMHAAGEAAKRRGLNPAEVSHAANLAGNRASRLPSAGGRAARGLGWAGMLLSPFYSEVFGDDPQTVLRQQQLSLHNATNQPHP